MCDKRATRKDKDTEHQCTAADHGHKKCDERATRKNKGHRHTAADRGNTCGQKKCLSCQPIRELLSHLAGPCTESCDHAAAAFENKYKLSHFGTQDKQVFQNGDFDFPWALSTRPQEQCSCCRKDMSGLENDLMIRLIKLDERNKRYNFFLQYYTLRYLDGRFYSSNSLIYSQERTYEGLSNDLAVATRQVFFLKCVGPQFWSSIESGDHISIDSEIKAWRSFVAGYDNDFKTKFGPPENYQPADFLFNKGVLWQLHLSPALLSQWLMTALYVLLGFEKKTAPYRCAPIPLKIAPVAQDVLVFLKDLRRRISYGFMLIGHLVKIFPEKDERVTKLIREDIIAPVLASLKVMLIEEKNYFQYLIKMLPDVIQAARNSKTLGNNVIIDPRNHYLVDPDNDDDFRSSSQGFSFVFFIDKFEKSFFGILRTKIEDLKSKINASTIHPLNAWTPETVSLFPGCPQTKALQLYLKEELDEARVNYYDVQDAYYHAKMIRMFISNSKIALSRMKKVCKYEDGCFRRNCVSTLLLEEQRTIFECWKANFVVTPIKDTELECSAAELEKATKLVTEAKFGENSLLKKMAHDFKEEWNEKDVISENNNPAPRFQIEAGFNDLKSKILADALEGTKFVYDDWDFINYILPFLAKCFPTGNLSQELEDDFSGKFLNVLIKTIDKDYESQKNKTGQPKTSLWHQRADINQIPKLLIIKRLLVDRVAQGVSAKFGYKTSPISKLSELLTLNAAATVFIKDHQRTPKFKSFYFHWTKKVVDWLNMLFFATTESISKCSTFTTEDGIKKKSLLLAIYSMVELVTLFQVEGSAEFSAHLKHLNQLCQNLDETYTALLLEQNGGGGAECAGAASAWQRVGVVLYLLYEMRKAVDVPREYSPPEYYPEEAKLVLRHFAAKDLLKLKLAAIGLCVTEPHRRNRTITTMALVNKSSPKLFAPYTARIKKGRIRRWHDDLLLPVKHCRFCGNLDHAKLTMCTACVDNDDYPDVNWFCGHECEAAAMQKCKHEDEHVAYIMSKISI